MQIRAARTCLGVLLSVSDGSFGFDKREFVIGVDEDDSPSAMAGLWRIDFLDNKSMQIGFTMYGNHRRGRLVRLQLADPL